LSLTSTRPTGVPRVVISGASSGIGTSLARYYARQGAVLGLIARRADVLEQLAASLSTPCAVYPLDVRDRAQYHFWSQKRFSLLLGSLLYKSQKIDGWLRYILPYFSY